MVMFRSSEDELLTSISIRMSTVDFFDNCIFESHTLDMSQLSGILEALYLSQLPQGVIGSAEKFAAI